MLIGALSSPVAAQSQKELIAAAKAIQKQLATQEDVSSALRAELAKIEAQVQTLLQTDPTTMQEKLNAATGLINDNQAEDTIAPQVDTLREAVFAYQIRQRDAFIAMLAETLIEAEAGMGDTPLIANTQAQVLAMRDVRFCAPTRMKSSAR